VKYHLKNLYDKLDVRNRAMAVALYSSEKGRNAKSSSG
jgi:DNA-binding CsgD family transcriptional regulator